MEEYIHLGGWALILEANRFLEHSNASSNFSSPSIVILQMMDLYALICAYILDESS